MNRAFAPIEEKTTTKERILDAAEALIAEEGFKGASLRDITSRAGVNLAAVNYHFQSKDHLVQAVILRRMAPVNEARLTMLDALEASGREPGVRPVLEAFLTPMFTGGGDTLARLLGRIYSDPSEAHFRLIEPGIRAILPRFWQALHRAMPQASPGAVMLGIHFAIGSTAFFLLMGHALQPLSGGAVDPADRGRILRALVDYAEAGLRALAEKEK
jgi:AcrR family transcriptional regulator